MLVFNDHVRKLFFHKNFFKSFGQNQILSTILGLVVHCKQLYIHRHDKYVTDRYIQQDTGIQVQYVCVLFVILGSKRKQFED